MSSSSKTNSGKSHWQGQTTINQKEAVIVAEMAVVAVAALTAEGTVATGVETAVATAAAMAAMMAAMAAAVAAAEATAVPAAAEAALMWQ